MEYKGKLYGKIGNKYFDTGRTSEDWDKLIDMIKELEQKLNGSKLPIHCGKSFDVNDFEYSEFIKGKGKEYNYISNKIHYFVNGELIKILNQ